MSHIAFYTEKEVAKRLGVSRTTVWRLRRSLELAAPVHISKGRVGYKAEDVQKFIDSREVAA